MLSDLFRKKVSQMIGLDIGTRYVKAVLLEKKGDTFHLKGAACEAILGDAFNEREIKDFDAISNAVRKVKASLKLKVNDVAAAVSGSSVLTKIVHMDPDQSDYDLEGQIELEADSLIPYPIDEVYLDFEPLGKSEIAEGKDDVLLSVAHKNMIDSRITLLRELEFEPKVIDIEGYALGNALAKFANLKDEDRHCCISIGASQLQVTVIQNDNVVYSNEHPFGVDSLVKDLMVLHNLDHTTAMRQLQDGSLPETWQTDTYPQFLVNLQAAINRALQLYASASKAERPEKIFLCGGGGAIEQLAEDIAGDMALEVNVFDPFSAITVPDDLKSKPHFGPQYAIAAGLATRSFDACHI